ncbi:MAG: FAD-binding protein [Coriobacteriales bacterium]|nr:FAD-binding protein [Coriobacteriales bacterium]
MTEETSVSVGMDRRDFLKGVAVTAGAALTATALAGCQSGSDPASGDSNSSGGETTGSGSSSAGNSGGHMEGVNMDNVVAIPPTAPPASYDYETDVLIIGFGMGGTMAALQVANVGLTSVILEKSPDATWDEHAGVQILAGIGGPQWASAKGTTWGPEDIDPCAREIWESSDHMIQRYLPRKYLENFPSVLADLEAVGCKFETVDLSDSFETSAMKYTSCTYTLVENDQATYTASDPWVNKYHGAEWAIRRYIESKGSTEILFDTAATSLIQDADGAVLGCIAASQGKTISVKARSTIIATGGFGANLDMCKYYGYITEFCGCYVGATTNNGDGIRMGMGAGGTLTNMQAVGAADGGPDALEVGADWVWRINDWFDGHSVSAYTRALIQCNRQPVLKVNTEGIRFMDENGTWQQKTQGAYVQPTHHFFTIYGGNIEEAINYIKGSRYGMCENMITPDFRCYFTDDDIQEFWDWKDTLDVDNGIFKCYFKADTLEELADLIDIDKENFLAQVERYNKYCETGVDEEFGKHQSFLFPVKDGPFHAFRSTPAFLWTTQGGLTTNEDWAVLNAEGSAPIPNLYAGSLDMGGSQKPYNQGMENPFQQASSAVLNGYLAAKSAIANAQK